jgi:hypothetical protein
MACNKALNTMAEGRVGMTTPGHSKKKTTAQE